MIEKRNLTALVASRICHDLISPIGAIGNGVELLTLSGHRSEEVDLIAGSVTSANGRIRLFRLVFGAPGSGQCIAVSEMTSILRDVNAAGRIAYRWEIDRPAPREQVQAAMLAAICIDAALVAGGEISVEERGGDWRVTGLGRTVKRDPALWALLDGSSRDASSVTAATVQFMLLPQALEALGRSPSVWDADGAVTISF